MSELSPSQAQVLNALGPLEGERVPGGCDECDAYQTVEPVAAGVWTLRIHHDEWCPFLNRREDARRRSA